MDENEIFLNYMKQFGKEPKPLVEELFVPEKKASAESDRDLFLKAFNTMNTPAAEIPDAGPPQPKKIKLNKQKPVLVQDELDLHGKIVKEAQVLLDRFISSASQSQHSPVMVITGRGKNSNGESVLKPMVRAWIHQKGAHLVESWAIAPRMQGGEGAFVLYLRKRK